MLDITKDIQSITTFRRLSGKFLKQLKKSKRPVVLTVNGKAAVVVQDAETYQRLLDIAAGANAEEGLRQGLDDAASVAPARQKRYLTRFATNRAYLVEMTARKEHLRGEQAR
jgi:prevent-host-death family protein